MDLSPQPSSPPLLYTTPLSLLLSQPQSPHQLPPHPPLSFTPPLVLPASGHELQVFFNHEINLNQCSPKQNPMVMSSIPLYPISLPPTILQSPSGYGPLMFNLTDTAADYDPIPIQNSPLPRFVADSEIPLEIGPTLPLSCQLTLTGLGQYVMTTPPKKRSAPTLFNIDKNYDHSDNEFDGSIFKNHVQSPHVFQKTKRSRSTRCFDAYYPDNGDSLIQLPLLPVTHPEKIIMGNITPLTDDLPTHIMNYISFVQMSQTFTLLDQLSKIYEQKKDLPPHEDCFAALSIPIIHFIIHYCIPASSSPNYNDIIPYKFDDDCIVPKTCQDLFDELTSPYRCCVDDLNDDSTLQQTVDQFEKYLNFHPLGNDIFLLVIYSLLLNGSIFITMFHLNEMRLFQWIYTMSWSADINSRIENSRQSDDNNKNQHSQRMARFHEITSETQFVSLLPNLLQPNIEHILPLMNQGLLFFLPDHPHQNTAPIHRELVENFRSEFSISKSKPKGHNHHIGCCSIRTQPDCTLEIAECAFLKKEQYHSLMSEPFIFFALKGTKCAPLPYPNVPYHLSPSDLRQYMSSSGGCLALGQAIMADIIDPRQENKRSFKHQHPLGTHGLKLMVYSLILSGKIMISVHDAGELYSVFICANDYANKKKQNAYSQKVIYEYLEQHQDKFPQFGERLQKE